MQEKDLGKKKIKFTVEKPKIGTKEKIQVPVTLPMTDRELKLFKAANMGCKVVAVEKNVLFKDVELLPETYKAYEEEAKQHDTATKKAPRKGSLDFFNSFLQEWNIATKLEREKILHCIEELDHPKDKLLADYDMLTQGMYM